MKIYTKDKTEFAKAKSYLDGVVFWRDVENNKVEIRLAVPNKAARKFVESLKD